MYGPALKSLLAKAAGPNEQGALQGVSARVLFVFVRVLYVCLCVCISVCVCIDVCIFVCMCFCVVCVCVCVCYIYLTSPHLYDISLKFDLL